MRWLFRSKIPDADKKAALSYRPMKHATTHDKRQHGASNHLVAQRLLKVGLSQLKRTLNEQTDPHEREADRVANQVMRKREPTLSHKLNNPAPNSAGIFKSGQSIQHLGLGQPLDLTTRVSMESRFGHDLSRVSVHTDARAAESAQAINALAYTSGQDIVFGEGQYAPETMSGKRLLAHELAHVVQQVESRSAPMIQRFESPEHITLGDTAGGPAPGLIVLRCHERDFPERKKPMGEWPKSWQELFAQSTPEQQRAMTKGLTYGEVVALSGDMYADFEKLNDAGLREVVRLIPLIRSSTTTTEQFEAATGGRYLALAKLNESHFSNVPAGHRNIDVWRETHRQAIEMARQGNANMAWGLNAAADHFLTDAFSGGHIRTPRSALMGSNLGNIESKILHDLDNTYGVEVTNLRGDQPWIAYGDTLLEDPRNTQNFAKASEAVQLSKQDIADALAQGLSYPNPRSTSILFKAETIVPRPIDPTKDRWTGRIPTYVPGPYGSHVRQADDYTTMRGRVVLSEGPGVVKGFLTDDNQIRQWVRSSEITALGRQPVSEKIRMLNTLIGGPPSYISEEDMIAMEKILQSVASRSEMNEIRRVMRERELDFSDLGQRIRFRVFLSRNP